MEIEAPAQEGEEGLRRRVARAEGEAAKVLGRLPYHRLVYLGAQEERHRGRVGHPRRGEVPLSVGFLLATNVLDREALPALEVLGRYKD